MMTGHSYAESGTVPFYAPWMEGDKTDISSSYRTKNKLKPDAPIFTPQTTQKVMEELGAVLKDKEPSALEKAYAERIVDELEQFGYGMFSDVAKELVPLMPYTDKKEAYAYPFAVPAGAVQEDFVLSSGDSIDITFRGQRSDRASYMIGNDGYLIVDDIPPIPAAGKNIGYVQGVLESHIAKMHNTEVFVSLAGVRQINVLVVGHVKKPGRKTLTVFHTVLDALSEAGGIEKTGSLRQIKLVRGGRSMIVDLYGLLVHGSTTMDLSLRDGDRLIIPPVGATVAVSGNVKRPGIYEILPVMKGMMHRPQDSSQKLSLQDMLEMGGGVVSAGQNRYLKLGLTSDGRETVEETSDSFAPVFDDGAILVVSPSDQKRSGTVELAGHTRRPGLHALSVNPALSALLSDEKVFGKDIYPLIGVIERWDSDHMVTKMLAFPPRLVLKEKYDQKLQDGDVIHLFSREQILSLHSDYNGAYNDDHNNKKNSTKDQEYEIVPVGSVLDGPEEDSLDNPVMISFLQERAAFIRGAVRQEGAYPVAEGTTLDSLLAVAGGLTLEANTSNIEVTSNLLVKKEEPKGWRDTSRERIDLAKISAENIPVYAGTTVRVNQKFHKIADESVMIIGEVRHPGRYDLLPGDKLSDLFHRAGGITPEAYPDGTIFSRESERKAEENRFRAIARDLELKLAAALEQKDDPERERIDAVQSLITQLKNAEAVGRITVESHPEVLSLNPELDILLEKGDRIYVPKRPLTVRVSGEVLSSANLQFRTEKKPQDYIAEAGGLTYHADKDRVFVVYPDGSAQPLAISVWQHNPVFIPPGSTIVVPRDPKPFDFIETARDISQILSNLAITGIFLDDIRDD